MSVTPTITRSSHPQDPLVLTHQTIKICRLFCPYIRQHVIVHEFYEVRAQYWVPQSQIEFAPHLFADITVPCTHRDTTTEYQRLLVTQAPVEVNLTVNLNPERNIPLQR
jgi:hypothetical protein